MSDEQDLDLADGVEDGEEEDIHTQRREELEALGEAHQSKTEARELRLGLRRLLDKSTELGRDPSHVGFEGVVDLLKEQDRFRDRLRTANESVLDSRIMLINSETASKLGKEARAESTAFDISDFFDPLRKALGLDRIDQPLADLDSEEDSEETRRLASLSRLGDWEKIGWMAAKRSRRVVGAEFMNGMMAVEHKKRVIVRKAKRNANANEPEVRPTEIRQEDMQKSENQTMAHVSKLNELLVEESASDGEEPEYVNFFRWFINPVSFGQSVENLFYTSFLVNNGEACIEVKDGVPVIYATEPADRQDWEGGNFNKRQVIMELDQATWKGAIETFNIVEPMIPHREEEVGQPGQTGWYS